MFSAAGSIPAPCCTLSSEQPHRYLLTALLSCYAPAQVLMFSATLHSPEVRALADKICQNPIIVDLKGKDAVPETG
jgi:superfamily II DNA/RNA helicase